MNLFKSKYNFKDHKYDNYINEIDNNDKALFNSKIISYINNDSLDDKSEVSFNIEWITYQSTQNDRMKLESTAEINLHIDELIPISCGNRFKEKANLAYHLALVS